MFVYCETPVLLKNPDPLKALTQPAVEYSCGKCILCRLRLRKEWTLRLRLEASLYEDNCFITLTYDSLHVPPEVYVRDIQLFVKRLRKNSKLKFRYYSVAEYGSHTQRPHFHLILFGFPLTQAVKYVPKSWDLGFIKVSPLTEQRCNYTCGYTQKKYDKKSDKSLYSLFPYLSYNERLTLFLNCSDILEKEYGKKLDPRRAEFATCSLGIGKGFLEKNYNKITEEYCIRFGGKRYSIPRYFRKQIELRDPGWSEKWKAHMEEYARERFVGFFDKVSDFYLEVPVMEVDGKAITLDYDGVADEKWKEYVVFRANNVKRKRELYKNMVRNKEI